MYEFKGKHLMGKFEGVSSDDLNNIEFLEKVMKDSINSSGATIVGDISVKFEKQGLTILVALKESHASIHTYPEHNGFFMDAFTCGDIDPTEIFVEMEKKIKHKKASFTITDR